MDVNFSYESLINFFFWGGGGGICIFAFLIPCNTVYTFDTASNIIASLCLWPLGLPISPTIYTVFYLLIHEEDNAVTVRIHSINKP